MGSHLGNTSWLGVDFHYGMVDIHDHNGRQRLLQNEGCPTNW